MFVGHSAFSLVTGSAIEEHPISLPQETLELLLRYAFGHYPFALGSRVQSMLHYLAVSEQRV